MIEYRKGNLLDAFDKGEVTAIAHGVNCQGGFGSGIAGQIAKRYPHVRETYLWFHKKYGWTLGRMQEFCFDNEKQKLPKFLYNCATQENCGNDGKLYLDYDALRRCMTEFKRLIDINSDIYDKMYENTERLIPAIPKIGAGLAGGDWNKIEKIINEIFGDQTIYVYVLEENK